MVETYYLASLNPSQTTTTIAAYNIWRKRHPSLRENIDANKLANVRRDIFKNKRLTEFELEVIKEKVNQNITNKNNVGPINVNDILVSDRSISQQQLQEKVHPSKGNINCQENCLDTFSGPMSDTQPKLDPQHIEPVTVEENTMVKHMIEQIKQKWETLRDSISRTYNAAKGYAKSPCPKHNTTCQ